MQTYINANIHNGYFSKTKCLSSPLCVIGIVFNAGSLQCRNRWVHVLDPELKKGPFDEAEQVIFLSTGDIVNGKWKNIAARLQMHVIFIYLHTFHVQIVFLYD
jgi:hypothetical protein